MGRLARRGVWPKQITNLDPIEETVRSVRPVSRLRDIRVSNDLVLMDSHTHIHTHDTLFLVFCEDLPVISQTAL